jgi:subtilisin family serine protease
MLIEMGIPTRRVLAGLSAAALLLSPEARAEGPELSAPAELIVDLVDTLSQAEVEALDAEFPRFRLRLNSPQSEDERMYLAPLAPEHHADVLTRLRADPRVEIAEPNWIYRLVDAPPADPAFELPRSQRRLPAVVDDPLFEKQWSFPLIGVPDAWAHADGSGVVVGVIDTGVAFEDHKRFRRVEDLAGTGFVEGYDFITDDAHPNDDHGHGTHVAGTIAQTTNNKLGVAGIAPKAKIMPLKVLSRRGSGTAGDIADAIRFGADEGAHILNLSLGGGPRSLVMEAAVRYARSKGVLVVCAAGNGARGRVEYPAAYVGAFAVSSVGPDKKLAYYSSYGRQVAVAAPGGNKQLGESAGILQNTITPAAPDTTDAYLAFQGTSMAAPHVAGVAALVMSTGLRDVVEVERILKETATDAGPAGWDERYGYGILNAAKAVETARSGQMAIATLDALFRATPRDLDFDRWGTPAPNASVLPLSTDPDGVPPAAVCGSRSRHRSAIGALGPSRVRLGLEAWALSLLFLVLLIGRGGRSALRRHAKGAALGASVGVALAVGLGSDASVHPLAQSVLPALGASILLLHLRRMRPVLLGFAASWAVALAVQLAMPVRDVSLVPGTAGLLDGAWLGLQATLALALTARLAVLLTHRPAGSEDRPI